MSEFNRLEFIKSQRPKEPFTDWRVYSLLAPSVFSALGFLIFTTLGYSFTEFSSISDNVRLVLVLGGGIFLAIGGELGTLFTTIEIGRKHKLDDVNVWDWIAMGFSLATTLGGFTLALATLLGEFAVWSRPVQVYGSIVVGALAGVDAYFGFWETGYLFADYTKRVKSWFLEIEQEQNVKSPADFQNTINSLHSKFSDFQKAITDLQKSNANLQNDIAYLQYPKADLQWFKTQLQGANGSLAKYQAMDVVESVHAICRDGGRRFALSDRTAHTWRKEFEK